MGKSKEVLKLDDSKNIVMNYKSINECSKIENISRDVLKTLIKKNKIYNNFYYTLSGNYSDEIHNNDTLNYKCPYCERSFATYNGLSKHVLSKIHGDISKEQLLTDFKYCGERPKCKCGCGNYTEIRYETTIHFADFVQGHNVRINNNWGHNIIAIEKSAKTRKKQYKDGIRVPWNKNKTWTDIYDEEKTQELKNKIYTPERNKKISLKLKGVPKSPEHALKCKQNGSSDYAKSQISKSLKERIKKQQFSISSNLEKYFIKTFIEPLNIYFETQYYIKEIKQYCDIFIPEKNIIIECDGSFWHSDPRLFPDGPKFDYQIKRKLKDEIKNTYAKTHSIKLLRFWEIDIINNPSYVYDELSHIL